MLTKIQKNVTKKDALKLALFMWLHGIVFGLLTWSIIKDVIRWFT